jgi:Cytochrome P460
MATTLPVAFIGQGEAVDVNANQSHRRPAMRVRVLALMALMTSGAIVAAAFTQLSNSSAQTAQTKPRYLPEYNASGDLILPKGFHEWVYVGSPLTPHALNGGLRGAPCCEGTGFPEYHNVYIEPGSYEIYRKTNQFPEGTIMFKELQLTLPPAEYPDGSHTEPSGRGYFPGAFNGADVTVKDSKRFADTHGWGYFNFNHHEPKAPTAKARPREECAFCHIENGAKKDDVWTQFYRLLDTAGMPEIK